MANAVSKSKIYIGTSATTHLTDTYVNISDLTDIGEFGDQSESIKMNFIDAGRTSKAKGTRDAGMFEFTVARNMADAGQNAIRTAAASDFEFNIKLEGPDKPNAAAGSKPTIQYLRGLVSEKHKFGGANDVVSQTFSVDLTLAPITVPPVTA